MLVLGLQMGVIFRDNPHKRVEIGWEKRGKGRKPLPVQSGDTDGCKEDDAMHDKHKYKHFRIGYCGSSLAMYTHRHSYSLDHGIFSSSHVTIADQSLEYVYVCTYIVHG